MKLELKDLKKATAWIEANTNEMAVNIFIDEGNKLVLRCFDRGGSEVEITLYGDSNMMAKIKKTDVLR